MLLSHLNGGEYGSPSKGANLFLLSHLNGGEHTFPARGGEWKQKLAFDET